MSGSVFRAYDIRGLVDQDFDGPRVTRLGRALGRYFLDRGLRSAVMGRDCRLSSPEYHEALGYGMTSMGVDVISVGMVPTPALYFAIGYLKRLAGVMITASHNPPEYNGFKIWAGKSTIWGEELDQLAALYAADPQPDPHGLAQPVPHGLLSSADILPAYEEAVLSRVSLARPLKVVVDGGNGAGGELCARILSRMGAEVIPLYCKPDGTFPNHHPDPVIEANMLGLREAVLRNKADVGLGLDGDADRLGLMDEAGRLLCGDEALAIYAADLLTRTPGATVIADVKCSSRLFDDITARGGQPFMSPTGHSLIKSKLLELDAPLAGEMSGHLFFNENWFGFDDALYGAALLLHILSRQDRPLSALPGWPVAFATREINLPCPEEKKAATVEAVKAYYRPLYPTLELDGARVSFPHGWGLVRASNTQPVLVTRYEADSPETLADIRRNMESVVEKYLLP